jgi:hypothetical protein
VSEQPPAPSTESAQAESVAGQPAAASASSSQLPPAQEQPPLASSSQLPPAQEQPPLAERANAIADEKPEIAAGAGFAVGFLFAMILRRLAR